jgi:hypothetical protein
MLTMQSKIFALLGVEGGREATLVVRRGDGQFALARVDARVASATRLAARYAPAVKVSWLEQAQLAGDVRR